MIEPWALGFGVKQGSGDTVGWGPRMSFGGHAGEAVSSCPVNAPGQRGFSWQQLDITTVTGEGFKGGGRGKPLRRAAAQSEDSLSA